MKAIAEEAETSEAMVVKTAKRLGFSGYKELRAAYRHCGRRFRSSTWMGSGTLRI